MSKDVQLRPVDRTDARFLSVLLNVYLLDVAPGATLDPVKMVERIWNEGGHCGLWIMDGPKRVGFALVRDARNGARELSEFCILGAYRNRAYGRAAAHALVNELPGKWFLGVAKGATGAREFWHKVLEDCPNIRNLKSGRPQSNHQSETLHFEIADEGGDPSDGSGRGSAEEKKTDKAEV